MAKSAPLLSAKDLGNPLKLDRSWIDNLIHHFSQVSGDDADLAGRLIRYVVDGTGGEVILELGGRASIGTSLRLHQSFLPANDRGWNFTKKRNGEREQILWPKVELPVDVWMRMGMVFDALFLAGKVRSTAFPAWPSWLRTLIGLVLAVKEANPYDHTLADADKSVPYANWSLERLEILLERADVSKDAAVHLLLDPAQERELTELGGSYIAYPSYGEHILHKMSGLPAYLARHPDSVRAAIRAGDATSRVHALQTLLEVKYEFTPVQELLVELVTGNAKTVRETTLQALAKITASAQPLLEKMLTDGDTAQRHEAVQAYWRLYGADSRAFLQKRLEQDSSDRIKQTITKLIAAPTDAPAESATLELPPLEIPLGKVPLGDAARAELSDCIEKTHAEQMEHFNRAMAEYEKADHKTHHYKPHKPQEILAREIDAFVKYVETGDGKKVLKVLWNHKAFGDAFAPPGVQLIHIVRMAQGMELLQHHGTHVNRPQLFWHNTQDLEAYRARCSPKFGLREVAAAVTSLGGFTEDAVLKLHLASNTKYWGFCNWEPEAIWPAFAEHLNVLHEALGPSPNRGTNYQNYDYSFGTRRDNAFKVLAMFPRLPADFVPLLWDLALGEGKADRLPAQQALASVPGKTEKIILALEDGKQSVRASAAEWLGRLGDQAAVEPLKQAFRKEKQEIVKGAILGALDALGGNVEEFLDRKQLLKDAESGLAKKKPKNIDWLPLEAMPELHWQDTGKRVDPAIVQWWAVQSIAQKNPVAGPLLRRYLQMCRPSEASQLSRWVLRAWIGADTAPLSQDEVAERAKRDADAQWQGLQHAYFKELLEQRYQNKKENLYQEIYNRMLGECKGSAIGEKGILALASAAGDTECVKLAEQYIRKWFGQRLAQCKALIDVLAWIDHPTAVQVLLSIGNRFRTKSIRDAAAAHVTALAERQGWTLDELADRTLPDAGFERATDDEGRPVGDRATLTLDYGPRTFSVTLNDDLEPVVTTADGKTVKAPPAPGKSDDEEKAKEAKKRFSDAKKTVKQVVKAQAERLYESMCTQRRWRFDDWRRYLAQHPIVGRLCSRLIWAVFDGNGEDRTARSCFRPLEDGSLTDEKDEPVSLPDDAILRLAHTCNVSPELESAWKQHLEDYDVAPLFPQFGQPVYALPEKQKKANEIKDFEGHLLSNFKLRGKATRLGYMRGQAEDGGWFTVYRKPFISLELEAILNFTGSPLPEEDRTVALMSLGFQRLKKDGNDMGYFDNAMLSLEKVPAVLLSECYNDIKRIAAEGSGFDPDWTKKSQY